MASAKIVVVEDNEGDVLLLRLALDEQREDYELIVLADGEQAIEFVQQQRLSQTPTEPCLILLDLHLPRYDGIEVLRVIKRSPVLAHVHVIVFTTLASPQDEAEIRALGAQFRIKPRELLDFSRLAADAIAICNGLLSVSV